MRFIHASIFLGLLDSGTAITPCYVYDLQTIANYDVSSISSYPISGTCIETLTSTLKAATLGCVTCTSDDLSSDACKFCYAKSATLVVSIQAVPLMITNATCTSAEMALVASEPCWNTATSFSVCPVSSTSTSSELSVSETCASCAREAFANHADDCKINCGGDMDVVANKDLCEHCSQAQYLSAASYCLTVGSSTTTSAPTTQASSAFASVGGLMMSSLLMAVLIVSGL